MSDPIVPGGQLASRPLHFIWLVDCSGSMGYEGKIQALNNAVREAIPVMQDLAQQNPFAQVLVRTLAFAEGARWVTPDPVPIERFTWTPLEAAGTTDLGRALRMVADSLSVEALGTRAVAPVLVLISDGQPTDDFQAGLERLLGEPWGKRAVRLAIGIGRDVDSFTLERFIANPEIKPLQANTPEQLTNWIRWASTVIAPMSRPTDGGLTLPPTDPVIDDGQMTW